MRWRRRAGPTRRRPAPAVAAEAAVAYAAARRAFPVLVLGHLVDVFAVAHVEAVAAELPALAPAPAARGVAAHRLLPALVAGRARRVRPSTPNRGDHVGAIMVVCTRCCDKGTRFIQSAGVWPYRHGVVDAVALGVVPVREERPGRSGGPQRRLLRQRVRLGVAPGRDCVPVHYVLRSLLRRTTYRYTRVMSHAPLDEGG